MDNDEMCDFIGCDSLAFISIEGLRDSVHASHSGFCDACFTGRYPVEIPDSMKAKSFLPEEDRPFRFGIAGALLMECAHARMETATRSTANRP